MHRPVMLITGGSRGIGAATALLAAKRGYDICFSYVQDSEAAAATVSRLEAQGAKALAVKTDLAQERDILDMFTRSDNYFGRLDVLVNNAAILRKKLFSEIEFDELQNLLAVNIAGSFICAREAVKRMSTTRGGSGGVIINISSIASRFGSPFEYIDYASTKGAIDTFTLGLAKEVATEGIRVNAVRPGIIATEIHARGGEPGRIQRIAPTIPLQRAGTAEEIANAVLWLASEEASYVTGSLLDVSGGR